MSKVVPNSMGRAPGANALLSIKDEETTQPAATGANRLLTWSIIGFLGGFNLQIVVSVPNDPREYILMSLVVGVFWGFVGLVAALIGGRWLGPTKTALPYSHGTTRSIAFNISVAALVAMKLMLLRGALPLMMGFIPMMIVIWGSAYTDRGKAKIDPDEAARRAKMRDPEHLARMIWQINRKMAHPKMAPETRERAERLVKNLTAMEAKLARDLQQKRATLVRWVSAIVVLSAWAGYFAFSFFLSAARADECRVSYLSGDQRSMCIRHAIEARDMALLLGGGGPLLALIAMLIWLNLRSSFPPKR